MFEKKNGLMNTNINLTVVPLYVLQKWRIFSPQFVEHVFCVRRIYLASIFFNNISMCQNIFERLNAGFGFADFAIEYVIFC